MAVILVFLLGIGNFAVHKAVLESRHPLLGRVPGFFNLLGGRFSLGLEFVMLLGALLMLALGFAASRSAAPTRKSRARDYLRS